ncbi:MAG: Gldg family protein [Candidatus Cloacimonetes bacterium]|nr:Gldg family protein [Candidatus Cloacimonadota bacterium]MBL7148591.1 Gldg family protein [Candidatus Cloacimonadota bacterium]
MKKNIWFDIIILIAIVIFVNLVSLSIFTRIDLSQGKIYSLSKSSKQAVKNLEDRLVIKAYFSRNLPGEYADARRFTQDILSEYQAYSRGKLRFEFIDPSDEESLKKEAQQNQIMPVSMRVVENDKLEIREVYMGLAFLYKDKVESLPVIQNTRGLEYDVTSSIKKISAVGLKKVAFLELPKENEIPQMPGQPNMNDEFATIRQFISESYEVSKTDLVNPVKDDIDALIIAGVTDSLSIPQLFNLDQFLMRGGNILFFQDRISTNLQTQTAETINSNLFGLIGTYGVLIKPNLVTDAVCGQVNVQQQRGMFRMMTPVSYPFFPVINNVNKENLIVKNLDFMQLIFASEIDTTQMGSEINFEPLFYTSENSGEITMPRLDIGLQRYMNQDLRKMFIEEPKIVAGIYSGLFKSFFAPGMDNPNVISETSSGRILYVTDSDFIKDGAGAGVKGNLDFVLNSVDYMVSEEALIEIRSRETTFRPLKEVSSATRKFVKWFNILFPSFLLIILGILRYRAELKRRKFLGELYE